MLITKSPLLLARLRELEAAGESVSDLCDLSCTAGYDNDGSTGPEMVGLGIGLAEQAAKLGLSSVFVAQLDEESGATGSLLWVLGRDEAHALERLEAAAAS